ncbi:Ascorbate-specific PTS system EIIC component [Raoultella planticola]|uniref:Ascorbate-specific PTS system EIIC component n=1 Tax=Raoultella planticola TaxID=575 RepID=A0A485AIS8_RAOPL|nr:Ascorbate-specific PTS system EIIC component [Raoultella planticola]
MLSAGAGVIVANLNPLGGIIEAGFNIRGVIPNNEAIVSVAQKVLGVETMSILLLGFIFNLLIARCTKYKYIFLTGHHSFFLACLFSAVLQAAEFRGWMLVLIGGFLLGSWSAISPAIGQRYTKQVTEDGGIAMGHFGSLGYYISAWIASKTGNPANSFADTEISEKWGFLRDTTVTTGIVMFVIYFVCSAVAGTEYLRTITDQNMLIFSILTGLQFAVGVAIVYNGVRLILGDLVPAFQGISQKLIPDSIPAVDCAVFFTFKPNGGGRRFYQLLYRRSGRDAAAGRLRHGADHSRYGAAFLLRRDLRRFSPTSWAASGAASLPRSLAASSSPSCRRCCYRL